MSRKKSHASITGIPTIRPAQWAVFEGEAQRRSRRRIAAFLQRSLPEQVEGLDARSFDDRSFNILCARGIATALTYGIVGERDQATFVSLQFVISPDFHHQPAIRRLLEDPARSPEERLSSALLLATPDDWEEAARLPAKEPAGDPRERKEGAP